MADWPQNPEFGASDIMNDPSEPFLDLPTIVDADEAADIGTFLDVNTFGSIAQWAELIKYNNLLKGVRIDDSGPRPSAYPLIAKPPSLDNFFTFRNPNAYIDSQTTTSEHTAKFLAQGWKMAALSVGTPFVSVAAEGCGDNNKIVYGSASYKYAFVTIVFDPETLTPSAKFTSDIENAMTQKTDDAKRKALRKVFSHYGEFFQTEVTLGAMLTKTDSIAPDANKSASAFKSEIRAKLTGVIPTHDISMSTGCVAGSKDECEKKEISQEERSTITTKGGNPLFSSATSQWISSIADYRTWRVIEVSTSVPTTEFIDERYREEAMKLSGVDLVISSKPLRGRWVKSAEYKTNAQGEGRWFRTYRPMLQDGWFWLGQSLHGRWSLLVREQSGHGNALVPVVDLDCFHTNTGSKAKDDESWWRLFPADVDNYVCLGDFFESGMTTNGSFPKPKFQGDSYNDSMRAVRKDLCVRATIGATEYYSNAEATEKGWVTVYKPEAKDASEPIIDPYLCKAYDMPPTNRNECLSKEVWMLKASSIYVEPWQ